MDNVKEKYQKAHNAFETIIDWQDVYSNPLSTLPIYTTEKIIKDQSLLTTGRYIMNDVKSTQEAVEKACK